MDDSKYITVSALSDYIKRKFDVDPYLGRVYLIGEISNYRLRPNAHQYFSLKDDHAKINAIMFRSSFAKIKFRPEEGMNVLVTGHISVYEPNGSYQIYVDHMEPNGVGQLYAAYEQLKKKLSGEGLFEQSHKKRLVKYPKRIAAVTSRSGAVIRDIITTTKRRYPIAQIVLFPSLVQGDEAASDIVRQIQHVNRLGNFDTLIVGRGGGSIEDLWPFNEGNVAKAIYNSKIPVISSVGHETDTTIADLVADQRAATPTAAAEIATPRLDQVLLDISNDRNRIIKAFRDRLVLNRQRLNKIKQSYVFKQPKRLYEGYSQQVDQVTQNLFYNVDQIINHNIRRFQNDNYRLHSLSPKTAVLNQCHRLELTDQKLNQKMKALIQTNQSKLANLASSLDNLSPLKTMSRGYTYVSDHHHKIIKSVDYVNVNDQVTLNFYDGKALTKVIKKGRRK
ncbi:exodeoxyribonuclease 7 large subunit [Philodulcilactobacillus myokoensis]|uniref:Exodeoxyribonuclease 7 large subunit n=1 Tax=Philodulcilactobacillus myokoensis TaxID=2929573 RepID=A0A9W6B1G9_9LACO|nr:exodeoxyribonuclease VII large subunit [Philodulcilactobacillus myokoensis]GLB46801.1 exodeoxyribonuclease 7 large subunit [Philodulcilactobacillus myokoensis]